MPWLDFAALVAYTSLSKRTLQTFLTDPVRPLPGHLVGRKWLFSTAEIDAWLASFPRGKVDVDALADGVVADVQRTKTRRAGRRGPGAPKP